MEKVIYPLWRHPGEDGDALAARLRGEMAEQLLAAGARALQVNVADSAVAPAANLRQVATSPQMDGMLALWIDSANDAYRRPFDRIIATAVQRMEAYLVSESQPLRNTRHPPVPGERTTGFSQLAFLRRPRRMTYEAWLDTWRNSHTELAIRTQSTFLYTQSLVVRPLTYGAVVLDGVVEECFPAGAMTDPQVFFDAPGDEAACQRNIDEMITSCRRFIDFDEEKKHFVIDVVPTSQYVIKAFCD